MRVVDTRLILGLSVWVLGFALMTVGWLIGELFEHDWGKFVSKIFYKTGAVIVATPIIIGLWKAAAYLYTNRVDIALAINQVFGFANDALKGL